MIMVKFAKIWLFQGKICLYMLTDDAEGLEKLNLPLLAR